MSVFTSDEDGEWNGIEVEMNPPNRIISPPTCDGCGDLITDCTCDYDPNEAKNAQPN